MPSVAGDLTEGKPPISVKFEIPYFTTSGIQVVSCVAEQLQNPFDSIRPFRAMNDHLIQPQPDLTKQPSPLNLKSNAQVRYLKIIEKSGYQALPWVRYITQNGDYQLRTA